MASPGRPRDAHLTDRIIDATLELLAEHGYDRLTLEAVARASGVSRSTIYTRWPMLADLVLDATLAARRRAPNYRPDGVAVPDTGSLTGDLVALTREGMALLDTLEATGLLSGLIADAMRHRSVAERLQAELLAPDEERYEAIFVRAVARGEIADDPGVATLVPRVLSAYGLTRMLVAHRRPEEAEFEALVTALVEGLRIRD